MEYRSACGHAQRVPWTCDDGRHTLVLSEFTMRPAEVEDVDAIVALLGAQERHHFGLTRLTDDELLRYFARRIHPQRRDEELLVVESGGQVLAGGLIIGHAPLFVRLGGWFPVGLRRPRAPEDHALFAEMAHAHLGYPHVVLSAWDDDGDLLSTAREVGFVDEPSRLWRHSLLDGRRVRTTTVRHTDLTARRTCPRTSGA
jgi:hypothetical protein